MKSPSGQRRTSPRASVQGHAYGANTPHNLSLDGILITWGDRLFYPGNRIVQVKTQPKLGASGAHQRANAIRQRIEATVVRRAPQVMVKVTGGGRGMAAIAAHFRYISKNGRLEIEDQRGETTQGKDSLHHLADEWRAGGARIPDEAEPGQRREAFNIMLSMPRGTDPLIVQRAAREFAQAELADHKYVMVLHDHQANPHVHISVRAVSRLGQRLNPRKSDLHRWRETFAEKLRGYGVEAEATRQTTRGQHRQPDPLWRLKAREEGRLRVVRALGRNRAIVRRRRGAAMMRFLPVNLDALLVELDDLPQTLALLTSLQAEPIAGIEELVPAARTLLVRYRPAKVSHAALVERIGARSLTAPVERAATLIEIPVVYSGEDLDEVAQMLGISREEVIRRHTASEYSVAFTGFAPGFAYLSGGGPGLNVPRRSTPRTRIPAGAVGLAGEFSAVYPQASPGGWQIIGVTAKPMWDLGREVPALLQPGFRVRFIDTTGRPALASPASAPEPAAAPVAIESDGAALEIISAGLQALFQDTGRHGQAGQGVSASGAMDQGALRAANRLVGNASDAACVEIAYGGFQFVCRGEAVVACTGADAPIELAAADSARSTVPGYQAIALSDGDSLTLGAPRAGSRSYLAVRGGFAIAPVLGSRSSDTLAHVGPEPIAAGDMLPVHPVARGAVVGLYEQPPADLPTVEQTVTLDVVMGPRTDWFTPEAVALLASQAWTATPQSNRVGLRLTGTQPLARANPAELPSEGTVVGAIQVPPSGQPVLFLADHPLTGGYPVIGAVATYHLDRAGQIPIGTSVRFNPIQPFGTP